MTIGSWWLMTWVVLVGQLSVSVMCTWVHIPIYVCWPVCEYVWMIRNCVWILSDGNLIAWVDIPGLFIEKLVRQQLSITKQCGPPGFKASILPLAGYSLWICYPLSLYHRHKPDIKPQFKLINTWTNIHWI